MGEHILVQHYHVQWVHAMALLRTYRSRRGQGICFLFRFLLLQLQTAAQIVVSSCPLYAGLTGLPGAVIVRLSHHLQCAIPRCPSVVHQTVALQEDCSLGVLLERPHLGAQGWGTQDFSVETEDEKNLGEWQGEGEQNCVGTKLRVSGIPALKNEMKVMDWFYLS